MRRAVAAAETLKRKTRQSKRLRNNSQSRKGSKSPFFLPNLLYNIKNHRGVIICLYIAIGLKPRIFLYPRPTVKLTKLTDFKAPKRCDLFTWQSLPVRPKFDEVTRQTPKDTWKIGVKIRAITFQPATHAPRRQLHHMIEALKSRNSPAYLYDKRPESRVGLRALKNPHFYVFDGNRKLSQPDAEKPARNG